MSIGTFRNWLVLNATRSGGSGGSSKSRATSASSRTALSLEAEFKALYAAERDQKLLAFLEAKVQELDAQFKVVQGAVRDKKTKMGLIDPSINE